MSARGEKLGRKFWSNTSACACTPERDAYGLVACIHLLYTKISHTGVKVLVKSLCMDASVRGISTSRRDPTSENFSVLQVPTVQLRLPSVLILFKHAEGAPNGQSTTTAQPFGCIPIYDLLFFLDAIQSN